MKTTLQIFITLCFIGAFTAFFSCSEDPAVVMSGEKDILSFSAPGQTGPATINASNKTVVSEVECGTDLTSLAPTFTLSEKASSSPASGSAADYSNQVTITVTAEDGTTAEWKVTISEACANATDILAFSFPEETGAADIDSDNHTIAIEVENGTDLTKLTPAFTLSDGATSAPASGTEGDYSNPATITVTAEDGTTAQDWTVTVTEAASPLSNATEILTFTLPEQNGDAVINAETHTIDIEVVAGALLTKLTPTFTLSEGATSDPASGTEGDYSSAVTITVTAEDETTTQDWTVTVTEADAEVSDATDILTFSFPEETVTVIDTLNHSVISEVVNGTNLTSLTPTFTLSEGATSVPESETAGDYSNPVTITVTAEDGTTIQDWTVIVQHDDPEPRTATDILVFAIAEQTSLATIDIANHTVAIEVVNGTDLSSLTPAFVVSLGATSNPESGTTGDYSSPVTITVTAEDGTTIQDWTVTVTEATGGTSTETDILSFYWPDQATDPVIDGINHKVWVETMFADWGAEATWTLSPGATSVPVSGTYQDYFYTLTIEVTAEDGITKQDWNVEVVLLNDIDPSVFCIYGLCEDRPDLREECQNFLIECSYLGGPADQDECIIAALLICEYGGGE